MAKRRKFGSRRHRYSRRHRRFNPIDAIQHPFRSFAAGYSIETAKMAGSVLAGGIGTMFVSNLVLDKLVGAVMTRKPDEWLTRVVDFLATGLVAGGVATGARYVLPYRANEVLAGGMLAAFSRLLPPSWVAGASLAPGMKGWSDDLGLQSMNLGDFAMPGQMNNPLRMGDYVSQPQINAPLHMRGMGDFVSVPQMSAAPQLIAGMGDFVSVPQAGRPMIAGMDAIVAGEIGAQ
jgi:hypothetical protein